MPLQFFMSSIFHFCPLVPNRQEIRQLLPLFYFVSRSVVHDLHTTESACRWSAAISQINLCSIFLRLIAVPADESNCLFHWNLPVNHRVRRCPKCRGSHTDRRLKGMVFKTVFITLRRNKIRMYPFVGKVQHEGFILLTILKKIHSVVGQFVGDIAFLRHLPAVYIESVFFGQIRPLPFERYPIIKPALRVVELPSYMPFPNHGCLITRFLKVLRIKNKVFRHGVIVICHSVFVSV